jgi:uncharacterized membrane protein required for colicin V production
MTAIDLLIIIVLILYAISGYLRGFLQSVVVLLGLVLILAAAWALVNPLFTALKGLPPLSITFILVFSILVIYGVYLALVRWLFKRISPDVKNSFANRLLGILPGLVDGGIMVALLLAILMAFPSERIPREEIEDSWLGKPFLAVGMKVQAWALDSFGNSLRTLLPLRIVEPGHDDRVQLPFHTKSGLPDPKLERQMFDLVNAERLQRGLEPLQWDDRLKAVARDHSNDMLARGYFSHYTPEGTDALKRIQDHGLFFHYIGENLALAPTLSLAHKGLMESPGHRRNILDPDFQRVGIGILVAQPYGLMVTQEFAR